MPPRTPIFPGIAEDFDYPLDMQQLVGISFGAKPQMEADDNVPLEAMRAQLVEMDRAATAIKKDLNALVKSGITVSESVKFLTVNSDVPRKLAPMVSRLLTAYTEVVAGLQEARKSIGYQPVDPSITTQESKTSEPRVATRTVAEARARFKRLRDRR